MRWHMSRQSRCLSWSFDVIATFISILQISGFVLSILYAMHCFSWLCIFVLMWGMHGGCGLMVAHYVGSYLWKKLIELLAYIIQWWFAVGKLAPITAGHNWLLLLQGNTLMALHCTLNQQARCRDRLWKVQPFQYYIASCSVIYALSGRKESQQNFVGLQNFFKI